MSNPKLYRINLLVPTYGRVKNGKLQRFIDSFLGRCTSKDSLHFSFLVNHDDEETMEFFRKRPPSCGFQVLRTKEDKPHLGKFYNQLYRESIWRDDPSVAIAMVGDDMTCQTEAWDILVLAALNSIDGLGIVHCRDGIQNGRIAVNFFTSRRWVEATGQIFMPEDWAADFIDVVHTEVASRIGNLIYLDNVFLRHEHASLADQVHWDETTRRLRGEWDSTGAGPLVEAHIKRRCNHYMRFLEDVGRTDYASKSINVQ